MTVEELLQKYAEIADSERNQKNKQYWENSGESYLVERWRGRSLRKENTPYTTAFDISGYSPVLGIACDKYYSEAEANLREQLRYGIWEYENLDCHRYFEKAVFCSVASVYEASFFAAKIHYLPKQAPWVDEKEPIFTEKSDLLKVKPFDFSKTGLVPKVTEMYEHHKKLAEPFGIKSMFPVTMRGPFSLALMLRGFENILMDMLDDEEFFADLMELVTGYLIDYSQARAKYLGETEPTAMLMNDEISGKVISEAMYREKIFPYEEKIAKHCGGVRYWHSCGETQNFYNAISMLPGLKMMHIGPWSDIESAAGVFGAKDIAIEICLNSNRDMYEKTEEEMIKQLEDIKKTCDGKVRYSVRLDGIAILSTEEQCMAQLAEWTKAAKQVFPG
jgi:uroporphyrinogen-III decarboxylase